MTFSVFDQGTPLLTVAETVSERLKDIAEDVELDGYEVTVIVTKVQNDVLSHAVMSTIDDHEELLETLAGVTDDCLEPYAEDDDQFELPLEKVTLQ